MKKNLYLIALLILLTPVLVSAQDITITSIVGSIVSVVWTVAVAIIIVLWVVTGILFLTSQGDPGKLKTAKVALFTSLAGTAIIILAWSAKGIVESAITGGT